MSLALVLHSPMSPAVFLPSQIPSLFPSPQTFLALFLPSHTSWALSPPSEAIKHLALPLLHQKTASKKVFPDLQDFFHK